MNFERELKKLNTRQKEAVETIEGPVMVIAGPGTGKTQILAMRVANILKSTDIEPESILAITFTESGVASMRRRLFDLIGASAYRVSITTFHGFANTIIAQNPDSFPGIVGATIVTNVEQLLLIQQILQKSSWKLLKPFGDPNYYVPSILAAISELKREGVDPKMFGRILDQEEKEFELIEDLYHAKGAHKGKMKGKYKDEEKRIAKNRELASVFREYEKELVAKKRYDYSDMITQAVSALQSDDDLLFSLQEKFQYVLVDEHQDTNKSQNTLIELLMGFHKNPNLFVVGDEKQAIFRFQGASLENFLYFQHHYPGATLITLEDNYRSQQVILDAASSVNRSVLSKNQKLRSQVLHKKTEIEVAELLTFEQEAFFVARHIADRLRSGVFHNEIAVLYRDNKDATLIAKMLERLKVPFVIESDQNIFEDSDIQKLLVLLRAISEFGNDEILVRALHADFLGIEPMDIYRLTNARQGVYGLMRSKRSLEQAGVTETKSLTELYEKLSAWRKKALYENATGLFETVVSESGFLGHILSRPDSAEKLEKLNGLFDEIKVLVESHGAYSMENFLEHVRLLEEHKLLIKKIAPTQTLERVRLMTVHRSKGQEFGYVYLVGAYDGHFGNRRQRENFRLPRKVYSLLESPGEPAGSGSLAEDDERNLFYVGLTRAQKEVVISYAATSNSGKEQLLSQFVAEISPEYLHRLDVSGYERDFANSQKEILTPVISLSRKIEEKEFIQGLFLEKGLSVTALNNYLTCPWQYFYSNLLRIPQAKNKHLMFGTAVHAALAGFFEAKNKGKKATKKFLVEEFEEALSKEPVLVSDREELRARGQEALSGYFDQYHKQFAKKTLNEFSIRGVELAKNLLLNGQIDKLEIQNEQNEVVVVDYKTGTPKSRNELLGKTKQGDGAYYRQLVFYKLLLAKFQDGKYKMVAGEIDFIQPDSRGQFHKEQFEISDTDVADLEREILRVFSEIWNLDFWEKRCEQKECRYCELREMMG